MKQREAVIENRLGQRPLPQSGWLGSEPLSWDRLRGKVVLLHFWDVNCAPCDMELGMLARWHNSGSTIIGIHRPTTDLAAVQEKLDRFGAKYPVLIDIPPKQQGGIGLLHDWLGNSWWPHAVLVSKSGVVAGHGQVFLGDVG